MLTQRQPGRIIGPRSEAGASGFAGAEDILLDVPLLNVDAIELEVANLRARVSLNAEVLSLVRLNVGADADIGKVRMDIVA
jgi:hypothetical protein